MTRRDRTIERRLKRIRRHHGIRKKIRGSAERPRLVVARSLRHIEGQLVDDDEGRTILGVSTRAAELSVGEGGSPQGEGEEAVGDGAKVRASYAAGRQLAAKAKAVGVKAVVFDRAGYRFQGRVKAFANGARAGGLDF